MPLCLLGAGTTNSAPCYNAITEQCVNARVALLHFGVITGSASLNSGLVQGEMKIDLSQLIFNFQPNQDGKYYVSQRTSQILTEEIFRIFGSRRDEAKKTLKKTAQFVFFTRYY